MKCKPVMVSYGIHLNTVLFPISLVELADSLEKKGYELSPALPFPRPPGRVTGAGEIARKGKIIIQVDASAQVLSIVGISIQSALDCFGEIASMLTEDHGINIDNLARFYGFTATHEIPTDKHAYETIARNLKVPILDDFSKILKEEMWPFGLNFAGAGLRANSENWLDISIRPSYERDGSYVIVVVYRNSDKAKTEEFMGTYEDKITKIIELIDR